MTLAQRPVSGRSSPDFRGYFRLSQWKKTGPCQEWGQSCLSRSQNKERGRVGSAEYAVTPGERGDRSRPGQGSAGQAQPPRTAMGLPRKSAARRSVRCSGKSAAGPPRFVSGNKFKHAKFRSKNKNNCTIFFFCSRGRKMSKSSFKNKPHNLYYEITLNFFLNYWIMKIWWMP